MIRRLLTLGIVAGLTLVGSLWWLHHGDLRAAFTPAEAPDIASEGVQATPPELADPR